MNERIGMKEQVFEGEFDPTPDYVSLMNDLLFHMVFSMNEQALRSLLSSLLNMPEAEIQRIEILNPLQYNESIDTMVTVLDLKVHLNEQKFILVEMQVRRFESWTNRTLVYACREIDAQSRGEEFSYSKLQPVIQIAIMNHTLFPDHKRFCARYDLRDHEGYAFSDKLQFIVLDLKAIDQATENEKQNGLVDWAKAFTAKNWETFNQIENQGVMEAGKTMEVIMSKPNQRQQIWNRRKALLDWKSEMEDSMERGIVIGEARGEKKGRVFEAVDIYRNDMKLDDHTILNRIMEKFQLTEEKAKKYVWPEKENA